MQGMIKKTIRSLNAAVAGATDITTATGIDMQGFDGIEVHMSVGTLTAGQATTVELLGCATLTGSYVAFATPAISAAMADGDSNKLVILDVYRPQTRFVKPVVHRATQNAVIDSVSVVLYKGIKAPVTQDTTVSAASKAFQSP